MTGSDEDGNDLSDASDLSRVAPKTRKTIGTGTKTAGKSVDKPGTSGNQEENGSGSETEQSSSEASEASDRDSEATLRIDEPAQVSKFDRIRKRLRKGDGEKPMNIVREGYSSIPFEPSHNQLNFVYHFRINEE